MKKIILITLFTLLGLTQAVAQEYDYLPIVREGVKWVNEKVIVNQGDTTRYYYNYEISGNDTVMDLWPRPYRACYYYTGDELDVENDSVIAALRSDNYLKRFTYSGINNAYWKVKHLFDVDYMLWELYGELVLYNFTDVTLEEDSPTCVIVDYYLFCQESDNVNSGCYPRDPYLTHDNFYEVEPVEIEGVSCRRWVIMGEDGGALAYVVEGIGFDSYDMGDLLTPFTCRPDPEADYQEWCGLSHVIKDGQIIYKGMRYRNGVVTGVEDLMTDKTSRPLDPRYYDLMGRALGTEVPTTPGIYIHQGKKVMVR